MSFWQVLQLLLVFITLVMSASGVLFSHLCLPILLQLFLQVFIQMLLMLFVSLSLLNNILNLEVINMSESPLLVLFKTLAML
jgi:hypothetical protein